MLFWQLFLPNKSKYSLTKFQSEKSHVVDLLNIHDMDSSAGVSMTKIDVQEVGMTRPAQVNYLE